MIDLHTHSYFSDGTLSPTELIEQAESLSMKAISITDHDTTSGLKEGAAAAKDKNVKFIPGIELSVEHKPGELHILGLGLKNWENAPILQEINKKRNTRNRKIIELMNVQGLNITIEDLKQLTKGTIGRPHFASWMVSEGHVKNINEAFSNYLTWGKPFYLPRETIFLEEAIDFIHNCGAYAIVAHPLNTPVNFNALLEKIDNWLASGIDGIEAVHSGSKRNMTKRLLIYGKEKGCMITGGSDFHGKNKPYIKLGKTEKLGIISDEFLPDELLMGIGY
ncbi:MAG: PHP domain-containing protein [Spirochaetales bacterium]|nr:PHP domain-containing protein [Spirochaetales bacterium]